jgi:homoserine dehydrogenase
LAVITLNLKTDELAVQVAPMLLPRTKVLANVNEVYNGISVTGDVVGETIYIGPGAGQDATASAVISDIVDAVTLLLRGNAALPEPTAHHHLLCPPERIKGSYYLRLNVKDEPGVLAKISSVTARAKVSIASLQQRACKPKGEATLILTTHQSNEKAITAVIKRLGELPFVMGEPLLIRIACFKD